MPRSLQPGTVVGRFSVVSFLGAGGMGEVYLARDESLGRSIALKILPPALLTNSERVRRFVLEAKAASSLNHPHIVTIYEIGEADVAPDAARVHYIAMELVTGRTLKELIHTDRTDLRSLVRSLSQVAEGIAKAHAAGIVHRDLKPENIMVSADGFAKVLDFGLAKLAEGPLASAADQSAAPTATVRGTGAGVILGTVGYMSPEQVQGKPADPRSDIFALGCILYEAATRQRPFAGDSDVETLHKILKEKPPAVEDINPNVPGDIRRLIRRCLAKSPDQRLQSMKDLALDLAEIAEDYDSLSVSSGSGSTTVQSAIGSARPRSTWERLLVPAAVFIGVAGLAAAGWMWRSRASSSGSESTFAGMEVSKIATMTGLHYASLSPDGRLLAFLIRDNGLTRLTVRQVATGQDLDLVAPTADDISNPVFSPDGSYLYYRQAKAGAAGIVYQLPTLGGTPQRIVDNISAFCVSRDGSRMAAIRSETIYGPSTLLLLNADGSNPRTLASFEKFFYIYWLAWSPDGRRIVVDVSHTSNTDIGDRITVISTSDGTAQRLGPSDLYTDSGVWLADGSGLVMTASEATKDRSAVQLWLLSWPSGELKRITNDANDYTSPSLSADSKTLEVMNQPYASGAWMAPAANPAAAAAISGLSGSDDFTALGNGSIVFRRREHNHGSLWVMAADGTSPRRLTPERLDTGGPITSRSGTIAFTVSGPPSQIWRVDADGGGLAQVPASDGTNLESLSPDGRTVYFLKMEDMGPLWKMPLAGGPEERVADTFFAVPIFSPDGQRFFRFPHDWLQQGAANQFEIFDVAGEKPVATLHLPPGVSQIRWAPSGDALTFMQEVDHAHNIWRAPIDGKPFQQLTHFAPDQLGYSYGWSADGSRLFFTHVERVPSEVLLIKNFR